jgi:hypothetical protein
MTDWGWVAVGVSTIAVAGVLIGLVISRMLAEIARCAEALLDEEWASAQLTRARRQPAAAAPSQFARRSRVQGA